MIIDIVIPALNEEKSVGQVIHGLPGGLCRQIIVCDNGSTDRTAEVAAAYGALVVRENEKGYGAACLRAIGFARESSPPPDILLFLDADFSDDPREAWMLVGPILRDEADLVIGSRVTGGAQSGSLTPVQRFGNWLSTRLIRYFFKVSFTDLGPFRAIRFSSYESLGMADRNFGWTVEMQVKAAKLGLRCAELPVSYRRRVGTSKISGTISGSLRAGYKILYTIFKLL